MPRSPVGCRRFCGIRCLRRDAVQGLSLERYLPKGPKPFVILAVGGEWCRKDDDDRQDCSAAFPGRESAVAGGLRYLFARRRSSNCKSGPTESASTDPSPPWIRSRRRRVRWDRRRKARQVDVVLIDTAGRLHTNRISWTNFAKLLASSRRNIPGRRMKCALCWTRRSARTHYLKLVISSNGRVTGLVLTKLDGTARGGIVVAIAEELKLPVRLIGVGESVEDLQDFHSGRIRGRASRDDPLALCLAPVRSRRFLPHRHRLLLG